MADRVLAGQVERIGGDVDGEDLDRLAGARRPQSATASATATAPLPVPTSTIRSGTAAGRARRAQPAHDLGLGELDEPLRLGPRDERPRVDAEGQPVELLEAADVGDRLAGSPAAR